MLPTGSRPQSEKSMSDRVLLIDGMSVPRFLYGTAWKEDETRRLVELALARVSAVLTPPNSAVTTTRRPWDRPCRRRPRPAS